MALDKLHEFYWIHPGALPWICSRAFQSLMSCASRMQHARRGVMSGDAPSHTSAVPDSTPPLGWNSAFRVGTPLCPHFQTLLHPQVGVPLHFHFWSYCGCEIAHVCTPRVSQRSVQCRVSAHRVMTLSIVGCSIIWAHQQWGNLRLFSLVSPSVR